jgi:hypothetical protein
MSKRSVFCISASRGRADRIVHELKAAAFSNADLSVLFLDRSASNQNASTNKAPASTTSPAGPSPAEIRGVMAWIASIRPLVIPGVSPLIAAGPVAAVLGNSTVGGIAGGLIDFDVPQVEASRYEARIKDGDILIGVHSENPEKSNEAREIFTANEAEDICTLIEISTPKIPLQSAYGPSRQTVA